MYTVIPCLDTLAGENTILATNSIKPQEICTFWLIILEYRRSLLNISSNDKLNILQNKVVTFYSTPSIAHISLVMEPKTSPKG